MGTNSQSREPPLAERGTQELYDQRSGDMRNIGATGLHRREKEKEYHIQTGITKDIDRPAMIAAAAVGTEAVTEAEVAAREGIDHRTMEAHLVEK